MAVPVMPVWNGGSLTDQQLALVNTGLTYSVYPPAAKATRSVLQTITTGTVTAIIFDGSVTSTLGAAMVNIGSNPTRVGIVDPGLYLITGCVGWAVNTVGVRGYALRKNGATYFAQLTVPTVSGAANAPTGTVTGFESFAATDYIELIVSQDSGGNLNTATVPVPFLAAVRISG